MRDLRKGLQALARQEIALPFLLGVQVQKFDVPPLAIQVAVFVPPGELGRYFFAIRRGLCVLVLSQVEQVIQGASISPLVAVAPLITMQQGHFLQQAREGGPLPPATGGPTSELPQGCQMDCAPTPSTLAQSKERKGSNFAA